MASRSAAFARARSAAGTDSCQRTLPQSPLGVKLGAQGGHVPQARDDAHLDPADARQGEQPAQLATQAGIGALTAQDSGAASDPAAGRDGQSARHSRVRRRPGSPHRAASPGPSPARPGPDPGTTTARSGRQLCQIPRHQMTRSWASPGEYSARPPRCRAKATIAGSRSTPTTSAFRPGCQVFGHRSRAAAHVEHALRTQQVGPAVEVWRVARVHPAWRANCPSHSSGVRSVAIGPPSLTSAL